MAVNVLADLSFLKNKLILDPYLTELPPSGMTEGQLAFVEGVLYIYSTIDSTGSWRPLTRPIQHYKHTQASASTSWTINHNLHTQDLIYVCYDENADVNMPSGTTYVDDDNITVSFVEAISGYAMVFAMTEGVGGALTTDFATYTEQVNDHGQVGTNYDINVSAGTVHKIEITGTSQITFSGWTSKVNRSQSIVLQMTNGGTQVSFPGVEWGGKELPAFTTSGKDRLVFVSDDNGTSVYGFAAALDIGTPV